MYVNTKDPLFHHLYGTKWAKVVKYYSSYREMKEMYDTGDGPNAVIHMPGPIVEEGEIEVDDDVYKLAQAWNGYADLTLHEYLVRALNG